MERENSENSRNQQNNYPHQSYSPKMASSHFQMVIPTSPRPSQAPQTLSHAQNLKNQNQTRRRATKPKRMSASPRISIRIINGFRSLNNSSRSGKSLSNGIRHGTKGMRMITSFTKMTISCTSKGDLYLNEHLSRLVIDLSM